MNIETNNKVCSKCKKEKNLSEFRKGRGKLNKKNYCIPCDDAYNKELYEKNKEFRKLQVQEWNDENPDKIKQYAKKWREKHRA